jgi:hypothetical protein
MRYQYREFFVTEVPQDINDFILWFKAHDNDPDDFVSLFVCTERADKWCIEHGDDFDVIYERGEIICDGMENDDAWKLRERLEAEGFRVLGVS